MIDDSTPQGPEAKFRALAEASPAAIFIVQGRRLTYVNPASAAIVGYDRGDLIGMDPLALLHPDDRAAVVAHQRTEGAQGREHGRIEVRLLTPKGHERWVDLTTAPFLYEGGAGIVGTAIDITDRKALEVRVERRHQLEAVGRLAGGVAHDFNNLLLVIVGETERLQEAVAAGDPLRGSVDAIGKAAARAAALTQHLLAFGRQQTLIASAVNINDVVTELGTGLWEGLGKGIAPRTELAPGLPAVRVDRTRLEQVLLSLVANAREAMGDDGRVTVKTDVVDIDSAMRERRSWLPAGRWVRLRVSDTGPGIPPDVLPRVFEPFFTTKRAVAGSGMGLSSVYGIVKQSDGFVWIDSAVDVGTTVTVLLPPVEDAVPTAPPPPARAVTRVNVLLVEDQDGVRELLTTVLKRNGFHVTTAATAEQALEIAPGLNIDLLLTDVVLPGMTGPELAQRICARAPSVRVLFMSGYTGDALRDQPEFAAGRAFIQKPFASAALVERIRSLLETKPMSGFSGFA